MMCCYGRNPYLTDEYRASCRCSRCLWRGLAIIGFVVAAALMAGHAVALLFGWL